MLKIEVFFFGNQILANITPENNENCKMLCSVKGHVKRSPLKGLG